MKFMLRKFLLQTKSNRKLFFSVLFTYILLLVVTLSLLVIGYSYSILITKQDMESLQISHLSLNWIRGCAQFLKSAIFWHLHR